jgi:phosphopantetheinyl transferase (holo-ACP synthase)
LLEKDFNYIHFVGIFQKYFKENELIFVKKIFKNKEDFVILTSNTNEIFYSSIFEIKESFLGEMNVFLEGGISQDGYNLANFLNSFLDINYKQGFK